MSNHRLSAAILTPPGEGGIGVIRLAGPQALNILQKLFRGKRNVNLSDPQQTANLHYGHLVHNGETLDEVLIAVIDTTPASQTADINCHGGIIAVERVMKALVENGAQRVPAAQLLDSTLDAIQREAAMLIPRALSRQTVRMLLAQHSGALSDTIREIAELPPPQAAARLRELKDTARLGLALCNPRRIVIAGSPNTGKSTLLNALVGSARAIVTEIPGTTRDFISETIVVRGLPVELIDTAGLRETDHIIEMEGIRGSRMQIEKADAVLFLLDASRPTSDDEQQLLAELRGSRLPLLVLANKIDIANEIKPHECCTPINTADICISAKTGAGLQQLEQRLLQIITGGATFTGGPVIFTERQLDIIQNSIAAAESGDKSFRQTLLEAIP